MGCCSGQIYLVGKPNTSSEKTLSTTTVLLAEDFEPFRRLIFLFLQKNPTLQVVAEVADGAQAIEMASTLRPGLILLDISLPRVDGIDAARQIQTLSPQSKVVFVTQHNSSDVVQESLAAGGAAYVVKSDVGSELLTAIDAALRGELFLSSSVDFCDGCNLRKRPEFEPRQNRQNP